MRNFSILVIQLQRYQFISAQAGNKTEKAHTPKIILNSYVWLIQADAHRVDIITIYQRKNIIIIIPIVIMPFSTETMRMELNRTNEQTIINFRYRCKCIIPYMSTREGVVRPDSSSLNHPRGPPSNEDSIDFWAEVFCYTCQFWILGSIGVSHPNLPH